MQKPSVPDLHLKRIENHDVGKVPDWSCSYRNLNLGQFSEIAEAQSEDAMRENSLSHLHKPNDFNLNFGEKSQPKINSRPSKHHSSHDRSSNKSIHDIKVDDYSTNQNVVRKHSKSGHSQNNNKLALKMSKAHSFAKPILPPLNIDKIREENQNLEMNGMKTDKEMLYNIKSIASNYAYSNNISDIEQKNMLALQGFHDVNMSEASKSLISKQEKNKIQQIPGIDTSDEEIQKDEIEKGDLKIKLKGIAKIRMLARKMVDQGTVKEIPELTEMLEQEHIVHSNNETPENSFARKPSNSHLESSKIA